MLLLSLSGNALLRRHFHMLEVLNLVKSFHHLEILKNFSLRVPLHGFTVLIGPSGCGKSTLFNVLTGVDPKDKGEIRWQGLPLDHLGQTAAYMQQKDLLLPWFTLQKNALLPARIADQPREAAKAKVLALFERLGLRGFETYLPRQVSGGMRQRCALVRTLMFERDLVLLDEPLSALDAITRRSLQALLLLLQSEFGKSILMITHDIEEALLLADEVLLLSRSPMNIEERFRLDQTKPRQITDPKLLTIKAHVLERLQKEADNGRT
ncbi:ABC transporter ATP-binding protein [Thermodesulfobacteriota bacterium]